MRDVSPQVKIRRTTPYLVALILGSVLAAAADSFAYWYDVEPSGLLSTWRFVFLVLLVLWVVEDSKAYPGVFKPFEFGFLVFLFAVPYLPYYLWRTRRFMGVLLFAAFVALYLLGYLAQVVIYAVYADG